MRKQKSEQINPERKTKPKPPVLFVPIVCSAIITITGLIMIIKKEVVWVFGASRTGEKHGPYLADGYGYFLFGFGLLLFFLVLTYFSKKGK